MHSFNPVDEFGGPLRLPSRIPWRGNLVTFFDLDIIIGIDILIVEGVDESDVKTLLLKVKLFMKYRFLHDRKWLAYLVQEMSELRTCSLA